MKIQSDNNNNNRIERVIITIFLPLSLYLSIIWLVIALSRAIPYLYIMWFHYIRPKLPLAWTIHLSDLVWGKSSKLVYWILVCSLLVIAP